MDLAGESFGMSLGFESAGAGSNFRRCCSFRSVAAQATEKVWLAMHLDNA
jgi:hypothetical protein